MHRCPRDVKGPAGEVQAQLYSALESGYVVSELFYRTYQPSGRPPRQGFVFIEPPASKHGSLHERESRAEQGI